MQHKRFATRIIIVVLAGQLILESGSRTALGQDCNSNGIVDTCDIDCGPQGGVCDVLGCGQSADCNSNGVPNECEPIGVFEAGKFTAPDGAALDWFGFTVDISGDVAIFGAVADDGNSVDSGSAHIYRFNGAWWDHEAKLTASDAAMKDFFGRAVAILEDTAAVGAYRNDDDGIDSGSAYVYRFNGALWGEEVKLTAADAAEGDRFGRSLGISGDALVIAAHLDDDNGIDSGSAYVFRFNGASWEEEAKLIASDGEAGDLFAHQVAISGNTILIGAPEDNDAGDHSGSAYVFQFNGAVWEEVAKLTASDAAPVDTFGRAVAISADAALIGAYIDDDNGFNSGSAYVYRFNGAVWEEEAKLLASDGATWDLFGRGVAISEDKAVVGAFHDDDDGFDSGSAYVFQFNGASWEEVAKLTASDGAAGDSFGRNVAISGDAAFIGVKTDDNENGVDAGSGYWFWLTGDCNTNGIPDDCDLLVGASFDFDENGLLDECDPDVDGDGVRNDVDVCEHSALGEPVNLLGGPMGDFDDDCDVDLVDYFDFENCFSVSGPDGDPVLQECFEVVDFDHDGDVDLMDFGGFQRAYDIS